MFQEFTRQEEINNSQQYVSQELLNLIHNDKSVAQFFDLLYNIKNKTSMEKQTKNICILNQKDKNDVDPLVDLEIEGYHVRQVVLDFASQVNIMTWDTWEQLGRPQLNESGIYIKLAYQVLIEPNGVWRNFDTTIKEITMKFNFEIIDPK